MKAIFLPILILSIFQNWAFGQSGCLNTLNPLLTQPTQSSLASSTCSTLVVKWQGNINQTYCVNATYFNTATNKKDTALGTNISCDASQSCTATIPVISGTQVTWSVQAMSNGNASYPVINVLENPISACSGSGISFCGKVLLQGPYDTATKKMNAALNSLGILQAQANTQPYNSAPFNYAGAESVGAGFFAAHPDIVDWILIDVRDPNAPSTILTSRAAFVKQDGTLVDTNGTNTRIFFPGIAAGTYHVGIRHRNHLAVRTAFPLDFNCNLICFDFTTASAKAFKKEAYTSTVQTGTVWAMRGGDANGNKLTSYNGSSNDKNAVLAKVGLIMPNNIVTGYYREDVNMDGYVRYNGAANDKNVILAIVGLLFPNNIIFEQFPN